MERIYEMADNRKQQIVFSATANRNERIIFGKRGAILIYTTIYSPLLYLWRHVSAVSHNPPVRRCPSLSVCSQNTILMGGIKDEPAPSSYVVVGWFV